MHPEITVIKALFKACLLLYVINEIPDSIQISFKKAYSDFKIFYEVSSNHKFNQEELHALSKLRISLANIWEILNTQRENNQGDA